MDRREIERLLEAIRQARAAGERVAVATVVRVKGSAYRREGTRMIIRESGASACSLSGGCLEPSVADAAVRVMASGAPVVLACDLADDSLWGLGVGCSGAVDIRIERLDDDEIAREWEGVLERGERAVRLTPLEGASGRVIVRPGGGQSGHLTDSAMEQEALARARARLGAAVLQSGAEPIGQGEVFFEASVPPPEVVIFGAGPDAEPLARQAWTLGFDVTAVDVRAASLAAERFPGVKLVQAHFSEFPSAVRLNPHSFVVVMNHHLERDRESLRFALESGAGYIGVLGPRSRYEKLLSGLADAGYVPARSSLSRVRSPVGLSIGAETPEEVALSILAEILAVGRGFDGGCLSGSTASLHRRSDTRALARS